jgi:hypothetical protein
VSGSERQRARWAQANSRLERFSIVVGKRPAAQRSHLQQSTSKPPCPACQSRCSPESSAAGRGGRAAARVAGTQRSDSPHLRHSRHGRQQRGLITLAAAGFLPMPLMRAPRPVLHDTLPYLARSSEGNCSLTHMRPRAHQDLR